MMNGDNSRIALDYLNDCTDMLRDISESNEMFHNKFNEFFNMVENSSFSESLYVSLSEEHEYQQNIFNTQKSIMDNFSNEICVYKEKVSEELNTEENNEDGDTNFN